MGQLPTIVLGLVILLSILKPVLKWNHGESQRHCCGHFRRAIGVVIVWGHARHKLRRLHYVRAKAKKAARHTTVTTGVNQIRGDKHLGSENIHWKGTVQHKNNSDRVLLLYALKALAVRMNRSESGDIL